MELAVGLMLILLGVLNLTGVTQWVTHRFTPVHNHAEAGIVHSHVHEHEGIFHDHVHSHSPEIQRTLCPIPEKWREIAASVNSQEGFMSAFLDGPLTAELRDMLNTLATACFAPTRQATSLIFSCRSPKLNPDQTYVACF
jgi:hypothetical protein